MIKEKMIRRENRRAIEGAFLDVHRQAMDEHPVSENHTHYPIENISRGGLRFQCQENFRIDERIEITVCLANGEYHSAMGRICYRDRENASDGQCYYGVSFLDNFLEMGSCI